MKSSSSRNFPDTVVVGRIRKAHGVRGEVTVEVLSDVAARFKPGSALLASREGQSPCTLTVEQARPLKQGLVVSFAGITDRDLAQAWAGASLEVARTEVPRARRGEYYYYELVGCRVRDQEAGELGEVVEVIEDGGGVLLAVEGPRGELLVPFVRGFLKVVDVEAGEIEVALPAGLVEACASK
ncbi:MAG TPA: ribosome maturation factor RimM [Thermoanaerobaculia bacterium]|nr:ribosome maturation factor RimM [Thermoanaerobaculia bacterium]